VLHPDLIAERTAYPMMRLERHGPVFVPTLDRNENVIAPAFVLRFSAILDEVGAAPGMIKQRLTTTF